MKKLILSLIVLLSILFTSCISSSTIEIKEQKNIKYKIFDNTGGSYETKSFNRLNISEIYFQAIDGTKVYISGNYTIEQIK